MDYPKLQSAQPLEDYKLVLLFDGGEKRIYDFKPNLKHKYYQPLSDVRLFKQVSVNDGEIEWVSGHDFCPHTLYEQSVPS